MVLHSAHGIFISFCLIFLSVLHPTFTLLFRYPSSSSSNAVALTYAPSTTNPSPSPTRTSTSLPLCYAGTCFIPDCGFFLIQILSHSFCLQLIKAILHLPPTNLLLSSFLVSTTLLHPFFLVCTGFFHPKNRFYYLLLLFSTDLTSPISLSPLSSSTSILSF